MNVYVELELKDQLREKKLERTTKSVDRSVVGVSKPFLHTETALCAGRRCRWRVSLSRQTFFKVVVT